VAVALARPASTPRVEMPASWVARENRRPGTAAWRITRRGAPDAIEGWADHVSAARGGRVRLFVSTTAPRFQLRAYRMGWYGGLGARLVWRSAWLPGRRQPRPARTPGTNMLATHWRRSLTIAVGPAWPPGDYLLELVASRGLPAHPPAALRDRPGPEEVNYKPWSAADDPAWRTDPSEVTTDWREPPLDDPESRLLGNLYECNPVDAAGMVVAPASWLFAGTGSEPARDCPGWSGPSTTGSRPRRPDRRGSSCCCTRRSAAGATPASPTRPTTPPAARPACSTAAPPPGCASSGPSAPAAVALP
jgi:hypothetical protein